MAAITGTLAKMTEFAGDYKALVITAIPTTASDAITLTQATHGISEITGIVGAAITGGLDAAFTNIQVSFSGLVITVASFEQDGTDATDWTGASVSIGILGK